MRNLLLATAVSLLLSSNAFADTIIKFDLGGTNPGDVEYVNGVFSTVNDGIGGTPGEQNSSIEYTGFLDAALADILLGASVTINSVIATGAANLIGNSIVQDTTGGSISLWSNTGTLLLTGALGGGTISGYLGGTSGSLFNTTVMTYTAGSLLNYVSATPAGLSLALTDITSGIAAGMGVFFNNTTNQFQLSNFTADASGNLTGEPANAIPEPTSIFLLGSAILGGITSRRKKLAS